MIQINLLPEPKKPDQDLKKILSPAIAYLIETSFEHARLAKSEDDMVLWGKTWAALLRLRKELLQPGFSPADNFVKHLILDGTIKDIYQVLGNDDE